MGSAPRSRQSMSTDDRTLQTLSPGEEVCAFVAGAAALFYWAEKDDNPGVKDYGDALHYVSAAPSLGYVNRKPVTAVGKMRASAVMTVGPALAAHALDGSAPDAVSGKLDEVIAQLRLLNERQRAGPVA